MRIDHGKFFAAWREEFALKSDALVAAVEELLSFVEVDREWSDLRHVAYFLATVKHETAHTMRPIAEFADGWDYDPSVNARKAERLGNTEIGDGPLFKGRGYVQITGRDNYRRFGELLKVPLLEEPERALEAPVSYLIGAIGMRKGLFTGQKLQMFINAHRCDYVEARRIINGLDKAESIAGIAQRFENILRASVTEEVTQ